MPHLVLEIFLWLLGLCVGSFLNVVVYRLSAGLSISRPARSFCPRCRRQIAWYDNVPLLSWFLLGGRCRGCRGLISIQYPLVEAITGLAFVLVYHAMFVQYVRAGIAPPTLPEDTPLLLCWLLLAASLVACSAMDVISYTIDTRITDAVLYPSIVLYVVWPRASHLVPQAGVDLAAAGVAVGAISAAMLLWCYWRARRRGADAADIAENEQAAEAPTDVPQETRVVRVGGQCGVVAIVLVTLWMLFEAAEVLAPQLARPSSIVALAAVFAIIVLALGQRRSADAEIHEAIQQEQPQARRIALRELLWLAPMIVAAAVVLVVFGTVPGVREAWHVAVAWRPVGELAPLAGMSCAVFGAVTGAAAGWVVRIFFTLAFGREAFGTGDIFILAAAGAASGWDIALLGFLLSVGIALAGWLLGLLLKSTEMIPFGPALSLGFVLALLWSRPAERIATAYADDLAAAWRHDPRFIVLLVGILMLGTGVAILLARLVRRAVVPDSSSD